MTENPRCSRCGALLPQQRVKVAKIVEHYTPDESVPNQNVASYDWETRYGDCIRCYGAP